LKDEKLENRVLKRRCDPFGKLFARNGRDAERRILRRAPADVEVKEVGSPDSVTSPPTLSVVVQLNVAAMLEVDVK